jgi:hypothetical protein
MSRSSKRFSASAAWLVLAPLVASCGGPAPAVFPTAAALPTAPRRPDGVALDPPSMPPPARDRASSADGLVTLRTPLGVDLALATVADLFRAIVREDPDAIENLFARDAIVVGPVAGGANGTPPSAPLFWEHRFKRLDYTRLAGEPVYREADVEILRAPSEAGDGAPGGDADVVVRVPIATPRVGLDRLFGDEIVLFMRREGDRYRIQRIQEDFQLP